MLQMLKKIVVYLSLVIFTPLDLVQSTQDAWWVCYSEIDYTMQLL